jgi:hypothetical protein
MRSKVLQTAEDTSDEILILKVVCYLMEENIVAPFQLINYD